MASSCFPVRNRRKKLYDDYLLTGGVSSAESNDESEGAAALHLRRWEEKKKNKKKATKKKESKSSKEKEDNSQVKEKGKKGKRKSKADKEKERDEIVELTERRDKRLQERIKNLEREDLEDLCFQMVLYQPLMTTLLEKGDPSQGYHPPPDNEIYPSWCKCTRCREMPTEDEKKCCGLLPMNCLSREPEMDIGILQPTVLRLQRNMRNDVYAMPTEEEDDENRAMRHAAYRQFILWHVGKLGKGDRRVLPSCCIWRIRDKFPDPFGQYTGFKPSRRV